MGAKELSTETLKELRRKARLRGVTEFCRESGVNPKTLRNMIKNGFARTDIVEKVERQINKPKKGPITPEKVRTIVCSGYGILPENLYRERNKEVKQVISLLLVEEVGLSRKATAKEMGYADHTMITWNIRTITDRMSVEAELKERVDRIRRNII